MRQRSVVVVGGGLSGLCCARTVQRAGHIAHVYEAGDGVGGRVRTDTVDGFRLDRGFQVLFTSYPALRQELNLDALDLQLFTPGARIYHEGCSYVVADPLRKPTQLLATVTAPLFPLCDKLNVARLTAMLAGMSIHQIFQLPDQTMEAFLRAYGFTDAILETFFRPFFGGIFLETGLETSVRMFAFVYKMLAQGQTAVPAGGMGELAQQIADDLTPGSLSLNARVTALLTKQDRVVGIRLEDGQKIEGDCVVLATEFDRAAQLAGLNLPATWRVSTSVNFALPEPLYREKLVALFTAPNRLVNHAAMISNVAHSYAPAGSHLLSCTILGEPAMPDVELADCVRAELAPLFPSADTSRWHLLKVYRLPHAQYAQPTDIWTKLPEQKTLRPGLILAGEIACSSSLHGALVAGQRAAALALSYRD
jgi:phytoene dehydrogenase-like protein